MASFTVFPYPLPTNCGNFDIDCSDPNSVLIYVVLFIAKELQTTNGVSLSQIKESISLLCPQLNWTSEQLGIYVLNALRRGILTTVFQPEGDPSGPQFFAVNAGMWRMNPANKKYFCICQLYTSSQSQ